MSGWGAIYNNLVYAMAKQSAEPRPHPGAGRQRLAGAARLATTPRPPPASWACGARARGPRRTRRTSTRSCGTSRPTTPSSRRPPPASRGCSNSSRRPPPAPTTPAAAARWPAKIDSILEQMVSDANSQEPRPLRLRRRQDRRRLPTRWSARGGRIVSVRYRAARRTPPAPSPTGWTTPAWWWAIASSAPRPAGARLSWAPRARRPAARPPASAGTCG